MLYWWAHLSNIRKKVKKSSTCRPRFRDGLSDGVTLAAQLSTTLAHAVALYLNYKTLFWDFDKIRCLLYLFWGLPGPPSCRLWCLGTDVQPFLVDQVMMHQCLWSPILFITRSPSTTPSKLDIWCQLICQILNKFCLTLIYKEWSFNVSK